MPTLILHIGFHKTGTKSVQSFLKTNAAHLPAHVVLRDDVADAVHMARRYARSATTLRLADFAAAFSAVAATWSSAGNIVVSTEDLAGMMPGRGDVADYSAVPMLAQTMVAAASEVLPGHDVIVYLSTRAPEAWLRSLWWQNLRATRLTLDAASYAQQMRAVAELDQIAEETRRAVAPARVVVSALEANATMAQGPVTPLLDLLGVSQADRDACQVTGPENTRPPGGIEDVFLALNRSGLADDDVADTKRQILRHAQKQA